MSNMEKTNGNLWVLLVLIVVVGVMSFFVFQGEMPAPWGWLVPVFFALFLIEPAWKCLNLWSAKEEVVVVKVVGWNKFYPDLYLMNVVLPSGKPHWLNVYDLSLFHDLPIGSQVNILCLRGCVSGKLYPRSVVFLKE